MEKIDNPQHLFQLRFQIKMQQDMMESNPDMVFIEAVTKNQHELALVMVEEFGASPNAISQADGNSCLMWAAWSPNEKLVKYLLEKGADANYKNPKEQTALNWAAMKGSVPIIKLLLEHKADLHNQDIDGFGVCHGASQHGKTAALDYLRMEGADVHQLDKMVSQVPFSPFCMYFLVACVFSLSAAATLFLIIDFHVLISRTERACTGRATKRRSSPPSTCTRRASTARSRTMAAATPCTGPPPRTTSGP